MKKATKQQLGLWLRPDIGDLLDPDLEVFNEEIIPLLDVDGRLDHTEVDENRVGGERRNSDGAADPAQRRVEDRWPSYGRPSEQKHTNSP